MPPALEAEGDRRIRARLDLEVALRERAEAELFERRQQRRALAGVVPGEHDRPLTGSAPRVEVPKLEALERCASGRQLGNELRALDAQDRRLCFRRARSGRSRRRARQPEPALGWAAQRRSAQLGRLLDRARGRRAPADAWGPSRASSRSGRRTKEQTLERGYGPSCRLIAAGRSRDPQGDDNGQGASPRARVRARAHTARSPRSRSASRWARSGKPGASHGDSNS